MGTAGLSDNSVYYINKQQKDQKKLKWKLQRAKVSMEKKPTPLLY